MADIYKFEVVYTSPTRNPVVHYTGVETEQFRVSQEYLRDLDLPRRSKITQTLDDFMRYSLHNGCLGDPGDEGSYEEGRRSMISPNQIIKIRYLGQE